MCQGKLLGTGSCWVLAPGKLPRGDFEVLVPKLKPMTTLYVINRPMSCFMWGPTVWRVIGFKSIWDVALANDLDPVPPAGGCRHGVSL